MDLKTRLESALGSSVRLVRELGGGGMSRVFLAEDVEHGREIVVKVVPNELAGQVNVERFRREIKVAARLQHPCIVPVISSGSADGLPYYTMPFVEGESLRAKMSRERGLSVQESLRILRDISGAVAYAHEHGVVHRDIKPENILVTKHHAVLADFGVAKALTESTRSDAPLTSVGVALGTPAYMAPEQAVADPSLDHRADIYALGVIAYEMLAGRHPFEGRSSQSMLAAHAIEQPNSVSVHRPSLPGSLAALITRMMAKHPGDRPQSAEEVLTEIDHVSTPAETVAIPKVAAPSATRDSRRRRLVVTSGLAGALLTVVAISMFAFKGGFKTAPLSPSKVLVLSPAIPGTSTPAMTTGAERVLDAVNLGLAKVANANVINAREEDGSNPEKAAAQGKASGAAHVVTTSVYQVGDKLQVQFRLIDVKSGTILRSLTPAQVGLNPSAAELDSAVDPLLAVIGFATSPLLGPAMIPSSHVPSFAAFKQFEAGVTQSVSPDQVASFAARRNFVDAFALDSGFLQARLWLMWRERSSGAVRNLPAVAYAYDTLQTYLLNHRASMSPFETTLADFVYDRLGTEKSVQALRSLVGVNPMIPMRRDLPVILADLNRPYAADSAADQLLASDSTLKSTMEFWIIRAALYHYIKDYKKGLEAARHARELAPSDVTALRFELMAFAALGDTANITKRLDMVAIATRNRTWFGFAGDLYLMTAQELSSHGFAAGGRTILAKAVDWFDNRTQEDWNDRNIAFRGAIAYMEANRLDDAEKILKSLMVKYPDDRRFIGSYGRLLGQKGDIKGALRIAGQLATLPSEKFSGTPAFERAQILSAIGRRDESIALLQEAFGQGVGFVSYRSRLHAFSNFARMQGYPPFAALITPQG
jgi:serine/threonine protein kinase